MGPAVPIRIGPSPTLVSSPAGVVLWQAASKTPSPIRAAARVILMLIDLLLLRRLSASLEAARTRFQDDAARGHIAVITIQRSGQLELS